MQKRLLNTLLCWSLCFGLLISITDGDIFPAAVAQQSSLEKDIKTTIESLKGSTDLAEEQKKIALGKLEDAQSMLETAQQQLSLAAEYEEQAASASQKVIEIRQTNQALRNKVAQIDKNQSSDDLENQLLLLIAEQNARLATLSEKQSEQTRLSLRAGEIAQQLSTIQTDQAAIQKALEGESTAGSELTARADILEMQANATKLAARIKALEREVTTIPARQSLVEAELIQLRVQSEFFEQQIDLLQSHLAESRNSETQKIIEQSSANLAQLKQQPALASIAQENVLLANLLQTVQSAAPQSQENMASLRKQVIEVQQSSETVDRVLATGRVTDELGELLRRLQASLPIQPALEQRREKIEEDAIRQQLDVILWQDRLRNMTDISATAKAFLTEYNTQNDNPTEQTPYTNAELEQAQQLFRTRRDLLRGLIEASNAQADRIAEEKLAINELLTASAKLRDLLQRRLIWLPSNSGMAGNLVSNLIASVEWFLSPKAWWNLLNDLYKGAVSSPALTLILLSLPILILAYRRRIKGVLWSLVDKVGNVEKDTFFTTPLALILTFVLALPLPIWLFTIAGMISKGTQPLSFSSAIATGLATVSSLSLILLFFRSMCRQNGMFDKHFDWSTKAREKLRATLTWFVWLQSVTSFIFAAAIASGESELRYGIAIIAFITASIGIALFSYQFFQPKDGIATNIVGETPTSMLTMLAFPILVMAPLAIGSLPLFGFFDTAVELQSKLFLSGTALVLAAVVYGLMLRTFLVTFRRYNVRRAEQEAEHAAQKKAKPPVVASGDAGFQEPEDEGMDEEDVRRQSRTIMLWITALLFIASLWFIWKPLLPALGIVDDIVVWQQVRVVDGVELSSGVTLWNILLSIGFVIGGFVAAKNIRGVMEIGFFERLKMDHGSRYATMTILGYILVGTGIVIGFSQLGIDWSKLQWIIAALGVGLGFGLQEIVANFVSGLIILFERPIRVGDFVTIGNLSGTVSNIKIRATTVTDFDNREVLLPNKTIITENVTNWTLRDAVTRIVVKIGVAYGSDIGKVRDLLMKVVVDQPDVLEQPAPQVFFLSHGDSSLDFEIRAFVDRPEKRLPLTHTINHEVNRILAEHDISIPFPQRDLHLVSGQFISPPLPATPAIEGQIDSPKKD